MSEERTEQRVFIQRHPLLSMFFAFVGTLTLCIIAVVFWYYSDADVDRVRAAAKAAGVELGAEKVRRPVSPQNILDALDELTSVSEQKNILFGYSDYYDQLDVSIEYPSMSAEPRLIYGDPFPSHLYEFYAKHMDVSAHDKIMACIEQLKSHKIEVGVQWDFEARLPHITGMQDTYIHLCEWMLTLPVDQFRTELQSAFVLLDSYPDGGLIACLVKTAIARLITETAFYRIQDVGADLVPYIKILENSLKDDIRLSMHIEFICSMNSMSRESLDVLTGHNSFYANFDVDILFAKMCFLFYRERELMAMMQTVLAGKSVYESFCQQVRKIEVDNKGYRSLLLPAWSGSIESVNLAVFRLQILRAIIEESPLPKDVYGYELKEIHDAQGKLLGYYSIGEDGIDDGWKKEWNDRPVWIYGELQP